MSWFIFAFLSAVLAASSAIVEKKTLLKEHAMEFSAVLSILSFAICLPLLFTLDYSELSFSSLLILFFTSILDAVAFLLVAKSLRHMEVSDASPLLVVGPAMTAIVAFIVLGEKITFFQVLGIMLMVAGSYVLELKRHNNFWEPFRIMIKSKYIHYIFLGLLLYAITSTIERMLLASYNMAPNALMAFAHLFVAFHFVVMMFLFYDGLAGIQRGLKSGGWWIFLVSLLTVGYRFAQVVAVKSAYVALVSAVKRLSGLFVTVIGGELFHEKNIFRKSVACFIILGGVLLLVL